MKRVYVAGSYSADSVLEVLDNIRTGIRVSTELLLAGYAPFCPWLDFQFNLQLRDSEKLSVKDLQEYSLAWLKVSDCMLVLPRSEQSKGTQREIEVALDIGIPIYHSLTDIKENEESKCTCRCCRSTLKMIEEVTK